MSEKPRSGDAPAGFGNGGAPPADGLGMAADPAEEAAVQSQMTTLFRQDLVMAIVAIVVLVVVLPFVIAATWNVVPSAGVHIASVGAASVVVLYNLTSIQELVRNYRRDRDFIYRLDVVHLRVLRSQRRDGDAGVEVAK